MFRFLRCCCDIICPPCPAPNGGRRGWTTRIIPGCQRCPVDCPPCPDFPLQVGYGDVFQENCPKCPKCEDAGTCWQRRTGNEMCLCIPQKFLCVISGVNGNCPCFVASTGPPPNQHFESSGSIGAAFCIPDAPQPVVTAFGSKSWGDDGPANCAPPTTLLAQGFDANIFASVSGFGSIIEAFCSITENGNGARVFWGKLRSMNCRGPWVVNNILPGCQYAPFYDPGTGFGDPVNPILTAGSGGTATFYACAC